MERGKDDLIGAWRAQGITQPKVMIKWRSCGCGCQRLKPGAWVQWSCGPELQSSSRSQSGLPMWDIFSSWSAHVRNFSSEKDLLRAHVRAFLICLAPTRDSWELTGTNQVWSQSRKALESSSRCRCLIRVRIILELSKRTLENLQRPFR